jgi:hypothetical protein
MAAQTQSVVVHHKMSRTKLTQRLHKKLPIWADGLKAVVLNHNGLAR